jgi:hypothetical protein
MSMTPDENMAILANVEELKEVYVTHHHFL